MRLALELLRIIFIFLVVGGIAWMLLVNLYTFNEAAAKTQWIAALGLYMSLFVLYRNKWQFSGWNKTGGGQKLPIKTTRTLTIVSIVLLITPIIVGLIGVV
ncbi:hypothetical protein MM221_14070 [Salipaludibacillus sp. LMS25]|jgi:hypothetical protein|uniref:hypothetical protein n=1 Tax=Salipaludibacillus sp. LMS25 TaxID=2924031 RepID=UPI0020D18739|nr:hypothetical protein [Salipaludibacillus sp. LMS25]UTR13737.1 hypothetical protein MM221_14070 [Salipaludibacillus sp. LMS25]